MIEKARELHPDKSFYCGDMKDVNPAVKPTVIFECMCLSSFEMTSEQFRDKYKEYADIIITIEPDEFRIYYL